VLEKISIIYEDEDVLAVNKPAGLMVHGDGKNTDPTLCDWLIDKYPQMDGVGEPLMLVDGREIKRPGIVHRIDRWTSGILLVAKNKEAHAHLKEQFQNREIKKTYYCFCHGHFKETFGTINAPLGRSKGDFRQYTTPTHARGEMREAVTYFEVEKQTKDVAYVKVMPKTGRTHQIRAHMVHIGHPIVGDNVYSKRESLLGFNRMALHAYSITFKTLKGEEKTLEAPLPDDFINALEKIS
jgi:23S rRNA pseudouridine1911/1915/1917 synthase